MRKMILAGVAFLSLGGVAHADLGADMAKIGAASSAATNTCAIMAKTANTTSPAMAIKINNQMQYISHLYDVIIDAAASHWQFGQDDGFNVDKAIQVINNAACK
jgi:hypothetical protein